MASPNIKAKNVANPKTLAKKMKTEENNVLILPSAEDVDSEKSDRSNSS